MKKIICLFACLLSLNLNSMNECISPRPVILSVIVASKSMECFDFPVETTPVKKNDQVDCPVSPAKRKTPTGGNVDNIQKDETSGSVTPLLDCPVSPVPRKHGFEIGSPNSISDLSIFSFMPHSKK